MSQIPHIAVVDDEKIIRDLVREMLDKQGYRVSLFEDGVSLRQSIAEHKPDLILLDLNLKTPGEDGFSIIREIKKLSDVPIILYTVNEDPTDRVVGLELGAADYLVKKCHPRELALRIRSALEKSGNQQQHRSLAPSPLTSPSLAKPKRVQFGTKWLDHEMQSLWDDAEKEDPLSPSEYLLLKAFADHPMKKLSRERLLALAPARGGEPFDRSIDVRVNRIRYKIEPNPKHPSIIRTVRGWGYLFSPSGEASPLE